MFRLRTVLAVLLAAAFVLPAWAADDEFTLKTPLYSVLVSNSSEVLKISKIEAFGVQVLAEPSVEFLIDLDVGKEPVTLVPSDFEVKGIEKPTVGNETRTSLKLQCKRTDLPLVVYVRYITNPLLPYIQKSITIDPCPKAKEAVLRRITLESCRLRPEFRPLVPIDPTNDTPPVGTEMGRFRLAAVSQVAAVDAKSQKGLFFFTNSLQGSEACDIYGRLTMSEEFEQPLAQGCDTGRVTIGFVNAGPELVYKRLREFVWQYCCAVRGRSATSTFDVQLDEPADAKPASRFQRNAAIQRIADEARRSHPDAFIRMPLKSWPGPDGLHVLRAVDQQYVDTASALDARKLRYSLGFCYPPQTFGDTAGEPEPLQRLRSKYPALFEVYQHVLGMPDGSSVDGEGRIVNGSGFIVLYNPSDQSRTVALPLDEPELELKGSLILSDWSDPASPRPLQTAKVGDRVDVSVPAGGTTIVAVNMGPAG